jgi:hypothetical protein
MAKSIATLNLRGFSRNIIAKAKHHAKTLAPLLDPLLMAVVRQADVDSPFILVNQMRFTFRGVLFKLKYEHAVSGIVLKQVLGTAEGPALMTVVGTDHADQIDSRLRASLIAACSA